jgi:hypothetical protein
MAYIPNFRVWKLLNLDSGQMLQGQFEAEDVSRSTAANWGQFTSLNRDKPILQFLNGQAEKFSFQGRFFLQHALDESPEMKLDMLLSWARIQPELRRPPILTFSVGDGHICVDCVIQNIAQNYGRPGMLGELRDVSFTVSLLEFTPYSIQDGEQTDTRYARARERDYFELLAHEEYGDPMIGDAIRKAHPELQSLQAGDIVRLPSIEGVRSVAITQKSVALKTAFGRKNTPQRKLRLQFFEKRATSYVSHIVR